MTLDLRRVWEHYLEMLWSYPGVMEVHLDVDQEVIKIGIHPKHYPISNVPTTLIHQGISVPVHVHPWILPNS
jgi:hypothetical protein